MFAWALTVAYATTGRPPFGTGPADAVLYRMLHEEPDLDGVPAGLRALLASALARSPELRPAPGQLLSELTGGGVPAAELPTETVGTVLATAWRMPGAALPPVRVPKWRIPRNVAAGVVAVALLALTAGILWAVLPGDGRTTASGPTTPPSRAPGTAPYPALNTATAPATSGTGGASAAPGPTAARPSPPAPPPSPSPSPSAVTGSIANAHSGLCVDTNGPQRPGLDVVLRACGNFSGQIWHYDETGARLTNTPSGLCLDTAGKPAGGVGAVLNTCGAHTGQQWRYDAATGRFGNPASGLCLDTNGPRPSTSACCSPPAGTSPASTGGYERSGPPHGAASTPCSRGEKCAHSERRASGGFDQFAITRAPTGGRGNRVAAMGDGCCRHAAQPARRAVWPHRTPRAAVAHVLTDDGYERPPGSEAAVVWEDTRRMLDSGLSDATITSLWLAATDRGHGIDRLGIGGREWLEQVVEVCEQHLAEVAPAYVPVLPAVRTDDREAVLRELCASSGLNRWRRPVWRGECGHAYQSRASGRAAAAPVHREGRRGVLPGHRHGGGRRRRAAAPR